MDSRVLFYYLRRMLWPGLALLFYYGVVYHDGEAGSVFLSIIPAFLLFVPLTFEMRPGSDGIFRVHQVLPVKSGFLRRYPFYVLVVVPMITLSLAVLPWAIFRSVIGDTAFWINYFTPLMLGLLMYAASDGVSLPLGRVIKPDENPLVASVVLLSVVVPVFVVLFAMDKLWTNSAGRLLVFAMAFGFTGLSWRLSPVMVEGKTIRLRRGRRRRSDGDVNDRSLAGKLSYSPEGRGALAGMGLFIWLMVPALFFGGLLRKADPGSGVQGLTAGIIFSFFAMLSSMLGFAYVAQFAGSLRSLAILPLSPRRLAAKIMGSAMLVLFGGVLGMVCFVLMNKAAVNVETVAAAALYAVATVFLALISLCRVGYRLAYGVLWALGVLVQLRLTYSVIGLLPPGGWGDLAAGACGTLLGAGAILRSMRSTAAYAPKQMPYQLAEAGSTHR